MSTTRYLGGEPCTSPAQVVRYLMENYADAAGNLMPEATAREIAEKGGGKIATGISVFSSHVYYLGDEAVRNHGADGWHELPEPDEDDGDDDGN